MCGQECRNSGAVFMICVVLCLAALGGLLILGSKPQHPEEKQQVTDEKIKAIYFDNNKELVGPKPTAYEKFIAEHEPNALTVRQGQIFMVDGKNPLLYSGNKFGYRGRVTRKGIDYVLLDVLPKIHNPNPTNFIAMAIERKVSLVNGKPVGRVAGDIVIGHYVVHVLSANDMECRYAIAKMRE